MAINVRDVERDQLWLMPPSVRDWLPEDHLTWFVLDVVAELDLGEFYDAYRADGRGGAVYDPALMLAVLIYAYCVGERSSRRIERRLIEAKVAVSPQLFCFRVHSSAPPPLYRIVEAMPAVGAAETTPLGAPRQNARSEHPPLRGATD